jgi:hypothetical protein
MAAINFGHGDLPSRHQPSHQLRIQHQNRITQALTGRPAKTPTPVGLTAKTQILVSILYLPSRRFKRPLT